MKRFNSIVPNSTLHSLSVLLRAQYWRPNTNMATLNEGHNTKGQYKRDFFQLGKNMKNNFSVASKGQKLHMATLNKGQKGQKALSLHILRFGTHLYFISKSLGGFLLWFISTYPHVHVHPTRWSSYRAARYYVAAAKKTYCVRTYYVSNIWFLYGNFKNNCPQIHFL